MELGKVERNLIDLGGAKRSSLKLIGAQGFWQRMVEIGNVVQGRRTFLKSPRTL